MTAPPPTDDAAIADLCFTARALAQTHPMTEPALRYRQERFAAERERQPVTELADWASTALLVGYCLRRAEEREAGWSRETATLRADGYEKAAVALSETLRRGRAAEVTLLDAELTIAALDRLIAVELDKRRDHLREQLDDHAWNELEDYIAWWVVHGYGVRSAEAPVPTSEGTAGS